jgi:phage-related protein
MITYGHQAGYPVNGYHGEVKSPPLSQAARIEAGFLLRRLQRGDSLGLPSSRPMPAIGRRCHELRINDEAATWRILYRVDADAIVIVEVFSKKTATTPRSVIGSGRSTPRRRRRTVDRAKKAKLAQRGWRVGSAEDFLELTPEEAALIELKLALSGGLKERRLASGVTQTQLARRLGSSQSRVAKMEAADPSVTVDLLIRGYLALGATPRDVARAIGKASRAA